MPELKNDVFARVLDDEEEDQFLAYIAKMALCNFDEMPATKLFKAVKGRLREKSGFNTSEINEIASVMNIQLGIEVDYEAYAECIVTIVLKLWRVADQDYTAFINILRRIDIQNPG